VDLSLGRIEAARALIDPVFLDTPGALLLDAQQLLIAVWALDIAGGQITTISAILNPDKLTHLGPVADYAALLRSAS